MSQQQIPFNILDEGFTHGGDPTRRIRSHHSIRSKFTDYPLWSREATAGFADALVTALDEICT